ncbi:MAG TPA: DUF5681 domain-containing protein [Blastocatellia bacterium]|nr:DUF5681 domain-containing protein [Blastocatellia bacterium]
MSAEEKELSIEPEPVNDKQSKNREHDERIEARKRSLANLRPFKKGESGNPQGRPKHKTLGDALRSQLREVDADGRTRAERVAATLISEAIAGSVRAMELIFARTEGRLPETIDLNVSRSEFEAYNKKVIDLQELAHARGMPISRAKAVALLSQTDPRIAMVLREDEDE